MISDLPAAQPDLDRIHSGPFAAIVRLGWGVVNGASLAALRSAVVFPSVLVITKAEPSSP